MTRQAREDMPAKVTVILTIPITTKADHLKKGMIVRHKKHGLVIITGGRYMGTYGISNFFNWKKITKGGRLGVKEYSGYDNAGMFEATARRKEK